MGNFFSYEGWLYHTLKNLTDMVIISFWWIICCVPVVTIGAATTALYYTVEKCILQGRGNPTKEFFHSFKQNMKQGCIAGVIMTALALLLTFNILYATWSQGFRGITLFVVYGVTIFVYLCMAVYIFPLLSRFTISLKGLFLYSFWIGVSHVPSTLYSAFIIFCCGYLAYKFVLPIFILPAVCSCIISYPVEKILKKYMDMVSQRETVDEKEDTIIDGEE
jgi:uncharacterized membrane protein YesL